MSLRVTLLVAFIVVSVAHASSHSAVRDGPLQERLIVLGDIHGDLEQTKGVLRMAEITDEKGAWRRIIEVKDTSSNSSTHKVRFLNRLIQVGDLVDRGNKDKEVMDLFMDLAADAESQDRAAGMDWSAKENEGDEQKYFETEGINIYLRPVTLLLGNHELMNLIGDFRYAHPDSNKPFADDISTTKSKSALLKDRKLAFSSKGKYGRWIRNDFKTVIVYNKTVFVHAGLRAEFAAYGADTLNELATKALNRNDFDNILFGSTGPVWTRTIVNQAKNDECKLLDAALKAIGAIRMVVGHTPERDIKVGSYCDDRILTIDVGISKWMYGGFSAIEITTNPLTHETEIREIIPNNYEKRSKEELVKIVDQGGMDGNMLQEILQSVKEEEKLLDAVAGEKGKKNHRFRGNLNVNDEL